MSQLRHLWGSVTRTACGLDAFRVTGTHVEMTSGPILRVVDNADDATCPACLAVPEGERVDR